ncbi:hypothetical protein IscW_ISCW006413 [Ixodes scapularis]|uniref:Uncharacterized protein n=1 Tax=Ixodes scapularis TaxID=6945 RepID=B7PNE0_IXOSC|nr:hypothetical protein IscW_ISCW006413 [Ixodes scapularis]|eukprot:XP_002435288.1 hypothetical protein IscW_ISCW006413 [Ixodes scapularis]
MEMTCMLSAQSASKTLNFGNAKTKQKRSETFRLTSGTFWNVAAKMQVLGICIPLIFVLVAAPKTYNTDAMDGRVDKEAPSLQAVPGTYTGNGVEGRAGEGSMDAEAVVEQIFQWAKSMGLVPLQVPTNVYNYIMENIPILGRFITSA